MKRAGGTAVPLAKIERPGVFRSFLFRQKGTEKPERHARSGKSPHSPTSGAAAHDHVSLTFGGTGLGRRALSPPQKWASGFACARYVARPRCRNLAAGKNYVWLGFGKRLAGTGRFDGCNRLQSFFVAVTDCTSEWKETPEMRSISHTSRGGRSWRRSGETANP